MTNKRVTFCVTRFLFPNWKKITMISVNEQRRILDVFYFNDILPNMPSNLRALATDSRVLYHTDEYQKLDTVIGKIASVYWTNTWNLADIFPTKATHYEEVAKGVALLFLQFLVIDNLIDGQTPNNPLIALLSHEFGIQARQQFRSVLPDNSFFWKEYDDCVARFLHGLALEYESSVAQNIPFSPEIMEIVDTGIAFTFRIQCTALGILSNRMTHIEPISRIFELMTIADQFGDDAIDWQDDCELKRVRMPVILLSEAENLSYDEIFTLPVGHMEKLLSKHGILLQMIDYAHSYLERAQALLPADCTDTWLDKFIKRRIEEEHRRKRSFSALSWLHLLSARLTASNTE